MINHKQELEREKVKLENELRDVKMRIQEIESDIIKTCGNSKDGHDIYYEIEQGPYGERYIYCRKCGYMR